MWNRFSFWCAPDGCIGGGLRTILRKGLPMATGALTGILANQLIIKYLQNEPAFMDIALSDGGGVLTAILVQPLMDYLLECCWHARYEDNYRDMVPLDEIMDALPSPALVRSLTETPVPQI